MKRIHILTAGWTSPDVCAFLFLLFHWHENLLEAGVDIQIFNNYETALYDCDVLLLESNYFAPSWGRKTDGTDQKIAKLTSKVPISIWFGIPNSFGVDHISPHFYVNQNAKNKLLRDREQYVVPIYGRRQVFAEYAHVKPNMNHGETWPQLCVDDETYFAHNWSMNNFDECIDVALSDPAKITHVAELAQQVYRAHTIGPNAAEWSVEHLRGIVS